MRAWQRNGAGEATARGPVMAHGDRHKRRELGSECAQGEERVATVIARRRAVERGADPQQSVCSSVAKVPASVS